MRTEKENKEIAYFDKLEDSSFGNGTIEEGGLDQEMLASIASLDNIMSEEPLENVSVGFTDSLLVSLKKAQRRKSIYKLFAYVFGIFTLLVGTSWFWASGQQEIATPTYVNLVVEKFSLTLNFISDPRFKQMFLISEAIICLVILEKVISGYRFFKFS